MFYSEIVELDTTNCVGIGVSIFVSGCTHHCKGCFNQETWKFDNGQEFTDETLEHLKELINKDYVNCFSILGGEPFEKQNKETVLKILKELQKEKVLEHWFIWSGYRYEDLIKDDISKRILQCCDILIDGEFHEKERDLNLLLRGSSNQRIIDLKHSTPDNVVLENFGYGGSIK